MTAAFDPATFVLLRDAQEVTIRSHRHPATGVVIWIVVVDDGVYVRSYRGARGRWYGDVCADPRAMLELAEQHWAVDVVPVADPATIAAVSQAFLGKYAASPHAAEMVRDDVLPTTLRLVPA